MLHFRCHFLHKNGRLVDAKLIVSDEVGEAVERAFAMVNGRPGIRAVELWAAGQKVYRTAVPRAAEQADTRD